MAPPVALVTGACSGIGFALTNYLLERKWNVVMVDINPLEHNLDGTLFLKCDVSSWDQQASAFQQAYEWYGRLDLAALNAGVDDRDDIFNSISGDPTKPPKEPNMQTINVNFIGVYYGTKLAAHYMSLDSKAAGKPKAGGKIVVTASAAGIYPSPLAPQYTGSKTGLVGLVRALAPFAAGVNIRINAICPAVVATSLTQHILKSLSEKELTPMSTIIRAISEVTDIDNVADIDWVGKGKKGEIVEGNMEDLIWHKAPQIPNSDVFKSKEDMKALSRVYIDRNRKWATTEWKTPSQ